MNRWVPTGCVSLDKSLEGGLPPNEITLFYGEAETGKTSLAMQCSVNMALMGMKTLFIDSDGTFSPERLSQIALQDFGNVASSMILIRPSSFEEQNKIVNDLEKYVHKNFGLVVFDTITSLYRTGTDFEDKKKTYKLNRELNHQVATLAQVAKSLGITILLTSQVRGIVEFGQANAKPVATRILRFWSNNLIALNRWERQNIVKATVEKSRGKEKKETLYLIIEKDGVHDYNQ